MVIFYSYVSLSESKDVGLALPVLHGAETRRPSMVGSRPPFSVQTCESHSPISSGYALGAPNNVKKISKNYAIWILFGGYIWISSDLTKPYQTNENGGILDIQWELIRDIIMEYHHQRNIFPHNWAFNII